MPTQIHRQRIRNPIQDGANVDSVDFLTRLLKDFVAVKSVDYDARLLHDGAGDTVGDWGLQVLLPSGGAGFKSLDWKNYLLTNSAAVTTLDWNNLALSGAWTLNGSPIHVSGFSVMTTAVDLALTTSNDTVLVDATAGNRTITLPTAIGNTGKIFNVKKIDASANTVTVDTVLAQTIDGAATQVISFQWTSITIQSDGANWFIL